MEVPKWDRKGTMEDLMVDPKFTKSVLEKELDNFRAKLLDSSEHLKQYRVSNSLNDIKTSFRLYENYKSFNSFSPSDVSSLINLCQNHLKTTKSRNYIKHQTAFTSGYREIILSYVKMIADDACNNTIKLNGYGAWCLLNTCYEFAESGSEMAIDVWQRLCHEENLSSLVVHKPKVVGVIIKAMSDNTDSYSIDDIYETYKISKNIGPDDVNLEQSIIYALIKYGRSEDAAAVFNQIMTAYLVNNPDSKYDTNLLRSFDIIHDYFIADSTNLVLSQKFFHDAINQTLPFRRSITSIAFYKYLTKLWYHHAPDYETELLPDYLLYLNHLDLEIDPIKFSRVNELMLQIFFERYSECNDEAIASLKSLISSYLKIRGSINEVFLNQLLMKVGIWGNQDVFESIVNSYQIFNVAKSSSTLRLIISQYAYFPMITNEEILLRWQELVRWQLSHGHPLSLYDWSALIRACAATERHQLFKDIWSTFVLPDDVGSDMTLIEKYIAYGQKKMERKSSNNPAVSESEINLPRDDVPLLAVDYLFRYNTGLARYIYGNSVLKEVLDQF
ncbi:hypothetical protein NADFUDRAFT_39899 [Nadsonia fulvescens var. elongata DSM 6958]|uniref:Uncharacterized protein n=1 Tax=Nadsonia fulvescens var. elongata DSM 6958 TaxID=857566 RepID=A0A1E3PSV7_9ASCO|nr:hypothetical protein NADFUDRAFT_39899 [Nadsonia fulvescens var. elongata DSM 6958]